MLTLYYKQTCRYSQDVIGEAESLGLQFRLKDIKSNPAFADELVVQGGKDQVPFLIDSERGEKLYESPNIIAYLREHYSEAPIGKTFGGLRVHTSDETCESCQ